VNMPANIPYLNSYVKRPGNMGGLENGQRRILLN